MLALAPATSPTEFERFGADIKQNLEMTEEFCDILDLAFSQDFLQLQRQALSNAGDHIPARPVQKPVAALCCWPHPRRCFRAAARHGYRVLSSGRVGGAKLLAEQYADIVAAFAAENVR